MPTFTGQWQRLPQEKKLLIGRRPVRNWISSLFLCRKLHFFLGKSTKAAANRAALFDSSMHQVVCQLGFAVDPTRVSLQRSPKLLSCIYGAYFLREEKGGSSSFVLGRKKKSRRLCCKHLTVQC